MDMKNAVAEIRKSARLYDAFKYIEEVLDAALNAKVAAVNAIKQLTEQRAQLVVVQAAVEKTAAEHQAELLQAQAVLEKVRVDINEAETAGRYAAEIRAVAEQKAAEAALATHEARMKRWSEECRVLEMRHTALNDQLHRARVEYNAMLKRLGLTAPGAAGPPDAHS